jgi:aarF domain-containing kinase
MRWPAAVWRPACACPLRAASAPALRQFQKSFASQSRAQGRPAYDFKQKKRRTRLLVLSALAGASILAFYTNKPFRHFVIAVKRCSLVVLAVSLDVIDYKLLFRQTWQYEEELESERGLAARQTRHDAYRACHKRCAERILVVLKKNGALHHKPPSQAHPSAGGIYVKLGQHISSVQLLPLE